MGLPADIGSRAIAWRSTGERQRLALPRAVAAVPRVLLLDEPTAALDAATAARVETLLRVQLAKRALSEIELFNCPRLSD